MTIARIAIKSDKHDEYKAWRRHSIYPYMTSHEGFVSATLLDDAADPAKYVIINKWRDQASYDAYVAHPREAELRVEAKEFVTSLAEEILRGNVVAVF